jgi:hypothetical protein
VEERDSGIRGEVATLAGGPAAAAGRHPICYGPAVWKGFHWSSGVLPGESHLNRKFLTQRLQIV